MHYRITAGLYIFMHVFLMNGCQEVSGQCSTFISAFPYTEDFETGPGGWFSGGISNDWALGTPQKPTINSAGSGTQSWISGGLLSSFYNYGERSWVQSPCFDFTALNYPILSFKIFWETENQYDGGNLQYSTDSGISWQTIGSSSEPDNCVNQNWYTIRSVTNLASFANPSTGWSGTMQPTSGSCRGGNGPGEWKDAIHCVSELAGEASVIFRFTMGSGTTCNDFDGIAFDLFRISESILIPFSLSSTCLGMNQIQFSEDNQDCHSQWLWNFGDSVSADNSSTLASPVHTFSEPGTYTITLITGSECLPESSQVMQIEILSVNTTVVPVTCNDGIDGSASVFMNNPPPGTTYSWDTNPVQSGNIAAALGIGTYTVSVTAPGFCATSASVEVVYGPDAFPEVNLGSDTVICPGFPMTFYPGSYSAYLWQDSSDDSLLTVYAGEKISVQITNTAGCQSSDTLLVEEDCLGDLLFPNSFSPNQDGINEYFSPVGNLVSSFELNIYNRWGQIVFTSDNISTGWDGSQNGVQQQEGIYIFLAEYAIRGGEIRNKTGRIFLLR